MPDQIYCSSFELICASMDVWTSAASWVQAIGSIAAIGFSYAAGSRSERARVKKDQQRAMSYGYMVVPQLELLWNNIHNAKTEFDRRPMDEEKITDWLVLSPQLSALLPEMHHLGDASVAIHQALSAIDSFREDILSNHEYDRNGGDSYDNQSNFLESLPLPPDIQKSYVAAATAMRNAIRQINRILRSH
ncbi:hypothetical protein [Stenotrophomonas sp.]|uniref:hypothetical protein n=1 Tax=Stenotrophomonas sp. TaxID=69392 RepID=UPI0028ACB302|nr:hypothetical protein [Stenotrophomonas sp.]